MIKMAIGDNPFGDVSFDLNILLQLHGITVTITRLNKSSTAANRDIYGNSDQSPLVFTAKMLFIGLELDEQETIGGGKTKEVLHMIGQPGTAIENDIIAYNGHSYDIRFLGTAIMGGSDSLETYTAMREVDF
jgi:hypothetical protein